MNIKGQEIFAAGKWNEMTFQQHDLEAMVAAFDQLKDVHKVPLKMGHNREQPVTDGKPALGWVTRIYTEGAKLLADFEDVPEIVGRAIKNKLYRRVSIELSIDVRYKGQHIPFVVDAVALLGADLPAVNTLADLNAYLSRDAAQFSFGRQASFSAVAGNKMETNMDIEIQKAIEKGVAEASSRIEAAVTAKFQAEHATLTTQLKAANDKVAAFEKTQRDAKTGAKREQVKAAFDALVKTGSLTPAKREALELSIGIADDERLINFDVVAFAKAYGIEPKVSADGKAAFAVIGAGGVDDAGTKLTYAQASVELDKRINAMREKNTSLSYEDAKIAVLTADNDLAVAYTTSASQ